MKLKLDENLGQRGAELLRQAGHDVATVSAQGLQSASDSVLIEACRVEERCLVTLDLDFSNPISFNPANYAGIVVLRLPPRPLLEDLVVILQILIAALEQESVVGKLWTIQGGRLRVYQPKPDI